MEDYIFLIIAVVISIFAAIKKQNNKADDDNPFVKKAERPRNFFMDQLLGEDFLDETEEEVKPQVMERVVVKKEPLIYTPPARQTGNSPLRFKSTLPDRQKSNLQSSFRYETVDGLEEVNAKIDYPGYLEDFSLRKAFIYSEILGRKYSV
jgi:hypothetical protein